MKPYYMDTDALMQEYGSDLEIGLSENKVITNQSRFNRLLALIKDLFAMLRSKFYYVNIISIAAYFLVIVFSLLNQNWSLFWIIISAFIISTLLYWGEALGVLIYQRKYKKIIDDNQSKSLVLRGGKTLYLSPDELMIGDIVMVETGSVLTADMRILQGSHIFADESFVFDRTIPAEKHDRPLDSSNVPAEEQSNMLFKGSYLTSGSGKCIVTALAEDCYIAKVGKKKKNKQQSIFVNKQKNLGQIAIFFIVVLLSIGTLLSLIFTSAYVETLLFFAVVSSLIALNPIDSLTEWTLYRNVESFYQKGALIRNIKAFDDMNRENEVYFDAGRIVHETLEFSDCINFWGETKRNLSYFTLCLGNHMITDKIGPALKREGIDIDQLTRDFPVFRREGSFDSYISSLFVADGRSVVVTAAYWQKMLPLLKSVDDELLARIREEEKKNRFVVILSICNFDYIPNQLNDGFLDHKMRAISLLVFDLPLSFKTHDMIGQLKHSSVKVAMINSYSKELGEKLAEQYDLELLKELPQKQCYTLPHHKEQRLAVSEHHSTIEKEQARLVYSDRISPQDVVYWSKCMFCGIRRCMNFLSVFFLILLASLPICLIRGFEIQKIVFPLLLMKPILLFPCYFFIESVNNCTKYRRSLLQGAFCGLVFLAASIFGVQSSLLSASISVLLLGLYMLLRSVRLGIVAQRHWILFAVSILIVLIPWFFMGAEWLAAILIALFAPLAAFILDFFY